MKVMELFYVDVIYISMASYWLVNSEGSHYQLMYGALYLYHFGKKITLSL